MLDSSSPSTITRMPTGGRPSVRAIEAACMTIPHLSSEVPRPNSRPSRSAGSNGGELQSSSGPGGWTSWCAYRSTVGAPSGAGNAP